jgi:uridine kinase
MNLKENIIVIGIGGCSRSGKSLLSKEIINQYKNLSKTNYFSDICETMDLDDYPSFQKIKQNKVKTRLGNVYENWEFPGSLDWELFYQTIKAKLKEMNSKLQRDNQNRNKKGILVLEGFLIFSPVMRRPTDENEYLNLFDIFIFISLDKSIAKMRRMTTTYVENDYYEDILWPEYIKNCSKYIDYFIYQKNNKKNVLVINGNKQYGIKRMVICILKWMNVINNDSLVDKNMYNDMLITFDKQI